MKRFWWLTVVSVVASYGLIVFGGIVRITGSGMGCGPDWPVCNGEVVPTFSLETAIEYTHRVLAALVTLLSVGLVAAGWRLRTVNRLYLGLPVLALVLVIAQALLGAVTVALELSPGIVMAHLGMAQAYLATLIVLGLVIWWRRAGGLGDRPLGTGWSGAGRAALAAGAAVYAILLSGAYTATSGASLACFDWPGCEGNYVPTGWTPTDVHLLHRWAALIASFAIGWLVVRAWQRRDAAPDLLLLAGVAAILMVVQIVVGAANIWLTLAAWVRALHLALATVVWGCLVMVATLDRMTSAPPARASGARVRRGSSPAVAPKLH